MRLWEIAVVQPIERMSVSRANSLASYVMDVLTALALLAASLWQKDVHATPALLMFAFGLLLFSFVEYCFHRWMFHGIFQGSMKLFQEGHLRHHTDPLGYHTMPFFLPPIMLLILAGFFALIMPTGYALLLAGAMATGYAAYGLGHFTIHITRFRNPLGKRWAAHHHIHHHHPDRNFGVTTSVWDTVLGTRYVSSRKRTQAS